MSHVAKLSPTSRAQIAKPENVSVLPINPNPRQTLARIERSKADLSLSACDNNMPGQPVASLVYLNIQTICPVRSVL